LLQWVEVDNVFLESGSRLQGNGSYELLDGRMFLKIEHLFCSILSNKIKVLRRKSYFFLRTFIYGFIPAKM